jgi:hypothetical protein
MLSISLKPITLHKVILTVKNNPTLNVSFVENLGEPAKVVLFNIARGQRGEKGEQGVPGVMKWSAMPEW